jgi:hypothetical protein
MKEYIIKCCIKNNTNDKDCNETTTLRIATITLCKIKKTVFLMLNTSLNLIQIKSITLLN